MNIGVDIDGVLLDLERFELDYGTKFCVEENLDIKMDVQEYYETRKFNWTEEQENKFWNRYIVKYFAETEPREFVTEIIKKLRKEGNKIYIITARNESGLPKEEYGKSQEITKKWLHENNIEYDKLIFVTDAEKLGQCIENDVKIMIEDSPINIKNISTQIPVIKFSCGYNENISGKNIITAYSWYQIYDIINKKMKGE